MASKSTADIAKKLMRTNPRQEAIADRVMSKKNAPGAYEPVALDRIDPDPDNPRSSMDPQKLQELSESIEQHGLIQPVKLTELEGGRYRIDQGHRRVEAHRMLGRSHIDAIFIDDDLAPEERLERQLVENIQDENLGPLDTARALQKLGETHGLSHRDIAKRISKSKTFITDHLALLKLPEELLERGKDLPRKKLLEAAKMAPEHQAEFIDQALQGATVSELRERRTSANRQPYFKWSEKIGKGKAKITLSMPDLEPDEAGLPLVIKMLSDKLKELRKRLRDDGS